MKGFTSKIVHSDRQQAIEHGAVHKPVHDSVAFSFEDAHELAAVFQGKLPGYTYGRQVNPTVSALENKITAMEQGVASVCFGTGMAAIGTTMFALLRAGDHVVSSAFLFGNTTSLFNSFDRQGLNISFVDATNVDNVANAITAETKMVFVETIANPRTQIADLKAIGELCQQRGLIYVVDNTMTSPYLFQPRSVGASLVVNSLTKYISGHGNVLGGVVTELGTYDWGAFQNIYADYRKGDSVRWGITQIRKRASATLVQPSQPRLRMILARVLKPLPCAWSGSVRMLRRWLNFYSSSRLVVWRLSIIQAYLSILSISAARTYLVALAPFSVLSCQQTVISGSF